MVNLKELLSRALHADEFEKTAQVTRQVMSREKRAELFTDFVNQGYTVKEASAKVDSVELAFSKMGSALGDLGKTSVDAAKDAFSDGRKAVVKSIKKNPLKWTGGALGVGGAAGYLAHGSNTGTENQ